MDIIYMMELDGEIGSGNWYPVIDNRANTFVPHRLEDGSVAWQRIDSIKEDR